MFLMALYGTAITLFASIVTVFVGYTLYCAARETGPQVSRLWNAVINRLERNGG